MLDLISFNIEGYETSRVAGNLLLCLYVIAFIMNRKATFLVAFLLAEVYGNSPLSSGFTDAQYYLGYVFIYSAAYWYAFKCYGVVKALVGYVTLIIFELTMSMDTLINADIETVIYNSYTYVIVFVHLYIIISLFQWRRIGRDMGVFIRGLFRNGWASYNHTLFWYTELYTPKDKTNQ